LISLRYEPISSMVDSKFNIPTLKLNSGHSIP